MKIEITDIPQGSAIKTLECKIDFVSGESQTKVVLDSKNETEKKPEIPEEMSNLDF